MTQVIMHGRCEVFDSWVPSIDTVICDPPYSAHVHGNAMSCGMTEYGAGVRERDLGFGSLTPQLRRWIASTAARVKRWTLVYSDVESSNVWRHSAEAAGAEYIRTIPWVRWSQPQLSGDRPPTGCEFVSVYHRAAPGRARVKPIKKTWSGPGNLVAFEHEELPSVLEHKALRGSAKHKTEKPLDQLLDLVSYFSRPGETVADWTCGRGTAGVACALLGRSFLGIERDAAEHALACARLADAHRGVLSERDTERVRRYLEKVRVEDAPIVAKGHKSDRAVRRCEDATRVEQFLKGRLAA